MHWLYRFQHYIGLTRSEALAVLTLSGLFALGLAGRHLQRTAPPPPLQEPLVADVGPSGAVEAGVGGGEERGAAGLLNLNTATPEELERLPRIGPKTAEHIVAYRSTQGPFRRVEDLMAIRGIGRKTLQGLAPLVYVEVP